MCCLLSYVWRKYEGKKTWQTKEQEFDLLQVLMPPCWRMARQAPGRPFLWVAPTHQSKIMSQLLGSSQGWLRESFERKLKEQRLNSYFMCPISRYHLLKIFSPFLQIFTVKFSLLYHCLIIHRFTMKRLWTCCVIQSANKFLVSEKTQRMVSKWVVQILSTAKGAKHSGQYKF